MTSPTIRAMVRAMQAGMLSLKTEPFPRSQSAAEHRQLLDPSLALDVEGAVAVLTTHILKAAKAQAPG